MKKRHPRDPSANQATLERLFDAMPHPGWICNAEGLMHFYNSSWYEFTGTTFEQLTESGWRLVHDPDLFPKVHSRFIQSLKSGTVFELDFPLRKHDGQFERFLTKVAPLEDSDGNKNKWIGISTNIQTLIENHETVQQQFATMADALPNIVWRADRDLNVDFFNQGWYDYTGTTPTESLGQGWRRCYSDEMLKGMMIDWDQAIQNKSAYVAEQLIRSKDGRDRWFLTRAYPLLDDLGNILSWFGTSTDIDDQKRSAEHLEELVVERTRQLEIERDKAVAADMAKSNFLAMMSHEVRTPLTGVVGLVELLSENAVDPEAKTIASSALSSSKRLMNILNDLLDASKLQAGQVEIEHRPFSLQQVINEVISLLKVMADKKSLTITREIAENFPPLVLGDELRVRQILVNLVSNAIKFTDAGGIQICCKMTQSDEPKVVSILEISDSGIGIPADKTRLLFQPFSQLEQSTSRVYGGTGLGLSISKNLVELMGGRIGVESEPGDGSKFWVEIPFERVQENELCD